MLVNVNLLTMPTHRIPWGTNCGCAAHDYMLLATSMPTAFIVLAPLTFNRYPLTFSL